MGSWRFPSRWAVSSSWAGSQMMCGMPGVTRAGCHVDRAACAWLIVRHIDDEATFEFVDRDEIRDDATPFDMVGVALSHHGDDCTFETMLRTYGLEDPVLWDLARIVHEADLAD